MINERKTMRNWGMLIIIILNRNPVQTKNQKQIKTHPSISSFDLPNGIRPDKRQRKVCRTCYFQEFIFVYTGIVCSCFSLSLSLRTKYLKIVLNNIRLCDDKAKHMLDKVCWGCFKSNMCLFYLCFFCVSS